MPTNETALMVPEDADIVEEEILPVPVQTPTPGLAKRLAEAATHVESLVLDGENAYHHYRYPTIAQVREKANHALTRVGVSIIPSIARIARSTRQNEKGKSISVTIVELEIAVCSEEGSYTARWVGESEDTGDKGVQKAASAAMKSWLANLLLIPVEEPENDDGATERAREEARQSQSKRPPQKQQEPPPDDLAKFIEKASFLQTHEERNSHKPIIAMADYWHSIKTAMKTAGYDDAALKGLLTDGFGMSLDLKDWVTGWFRLLNRFAQYITEAPDGLEYAKSVMRQGIAAQMDWDRAAEALDKPLIENDPVVEAAIEELGAVPQENTDSDTIPDL